MRHFHFGRGLFSAALIASLGLIQIAKADPLPVTVDGVGPDGLTSRWLVGQDSFNETSIGALNGTANRLLNGAVVVARDDCGNRSALTRVDQSTATDYRFRDTDGMVGVATVDGVTTISAGPQTSALQPGLVFSQDYAVIDGPGVMRVLFTMENVSGAAVTKKVTLVHDLSFQTTVEASSDGDTSPINVDDRWIIYSGSGSTCGGVPKTVDTLVFYGDGSPEVTAFSAGTFNDIYGETFDNIVVPAGEKRYVLSFLAMHDNVADAIDDASLFDNVQSGSVLLKGLTTEQLANIVNWDLLGPPLTCEGFDAPMDVLVTVKKNRALPLKARLFDEFDVAITGSDILSHPVLQVSFTSAVGGDPVDVTDDALPAGQSSEGNIFSYDESTGNWQFNLKTKNYEAPGTYTITMESGDQSEYVLDPTCMATFVIE